MSRLERTALGETDGQAVDDLKVRSRNGEEFQEMTP
jgi:hypothetical protein